MSEWAQDLTDLVSSPGWPTLLYFTAASLVTVGIEALRRFVTHRMDLWESRNPLPEKEEEDDD